MKKMVITILILGLILIVISVGLLISVHNPKPDIFKKKVDTLLDSAGFLEPTFFYDSEYETNDIKINGNKIKRIFMTKDNDSFGRTKYYYSLELEMNGKLIENRLYIYVFGLIPREDFVQKILTKSNEKDEEGYQMFDNELEDSLFSISMIALDKIPNIADYKKYIKETTKL